MRWNIAQPENGDGDYSLSLAQTDGKPLPEVWLAVGPEGGFTEREIEAAVATGWRRASLGPRVLRTETAGDVAPALVLHAWGDLGL